MRVGNRIFPYPVLNRDEELSDYIESSTFKLIFDCDNNGSPFIRDNEIIFQNLHYTIEDPYLSSLLEQGKIKGAFIVECSSSMYRESFNITQLPIDLKISLNEFNDNIIVSCYLYAIEDIPGFKSTSFISEFANFSFDIDKFDILAVDDGFRIKINREPIDDDKVSSIFSVIKRYEDIDTLSYSNSDRDITIYLPEKYYNSYDNIKTESKYNNIAFGLLAIPVLATCLTDISYDQNYLTIDDILDEHSWFNAILKSYKRKTGNNLTMEEFESIDKLELAQLVLNSGLCKGLMDFDNILLGAMENRDEEDSDE